MALSANIRKVKPEDIRCISLMEQKCFSGSTAYSRRQIRYLALKANSTCLVETQGNIVRGFIIVLYRRGSKAAGIETIDVDPAFQKKGIGLRLLSAAEHDMKNHCVTRSRLEVSEGNKAAVGLYKKMGYIFQKRLPNYYKYEHNGTRNAIRLFKILQ